MVWACVAPLIANWFKNTPVHHKNQLSPHVLFSVGPTCLRSSEPVPVLRKWWPVLKMVFMLKHRTLVCNHSSDFGFSFIFLVFLFFSMTLVGRGAPFPQQNADLKTGEVRALCVCLCDFSLPFRSQSNRFFFFTCPYSPFQWIYVLDQTKSEPGIQINYTDHRPNKGPQPSPLKDIDAAKAACRCSFYFPIHF